MPKWFWNFWKLLFEYLQIIFVILGVSKSLFSTKSLFWFLIFENYYFEYLQITFVIYKVFQNHYFFLQSLLWFLIFWKLLFYQVRRNPRYRKLQPHAQTLWSQTQEPDKLPWGGHRHTLSPDTPWQCDAGILRVAAVYIRPWCLKLQNRVRHDGSDLLCKNWQIVKICTHLILKGDLWSLIELLLCFKINKSSTVIFDLI